MTIVTDVNRAAFAEAVRPALEAIAQQLGADRAARIRGFHA
jgi:hypothetical protein